MSLLIRERFCFREFFLVCGELRSATNVLEALCYVAHVRVAGIIIFKSYGKLIKIIIMNHNIENSTNAAYK